MWLKEVLAEGVLDEGGVRVEVMGGRRKGCCRAGGMGGVSLASVSGIVTDERSSTRRRP